MAQPPPRPDEVRSRDETHIGPTKLCPNLGLALRRGGWSAVVGGWSALADLPREEGPCCEERPCEERPCEERPCEERPCCSADAAALAAACCMATRCKLARGGRHRQRQSEAISGNQWQSVAISGNQWSSPGTWGGHRRLATLEAATIGYGHHLMRDAISEQAHRLSGNQHALSPAPNPSEPTPPFRTHAPC